MPLTDTKISTTGRESMTQTDEPSPGEERKASLATRIFRRLENTSGAANRRFQLLLSKRLLRSGDNWLPLLTTLQKRWGSKENSYMPKSGIWAYALPSKITSHRKTGIHLRPVGFKNRTPGDLSGYSMIPSGQDALKNNSLIETQVYQKDRNPSEALQSSRFGSNHSPEHETMSSLSIRRHSGSDKPEETSLNIPIKKMKSGNKSILSGRNKESFLSIPLAVSQPSGIGQIEAPILLRRKKQVSGNEVSKPPEINQEERLSKDRDSAPKGSKVYHQSLSKISAMTKILHTKSGIPKTAVNQRDRYLPGMETQLSLAVLSRNSTHGKNMNGNASGQPQSSTAINTFKVYPDRQPSRSGLNKPIAYSPKMETDKALSRKISGRYGLNPLPHLFMVETKQFQPRVSMSDPIFRFLHSTLTLRPQPVISTQNLKQYDPFSIYSTQNMVHTKAMTIENEKMFSSDNLRDNHKSKPLVPKSRPPERIPAYPHKGSRNKSMSGSPSDHSLIQKTVLDRPFPERNQMVHPSKSQSEKGSDTETNPVGNGTISSENDTSDSVDLNHLVDKIWYKLMRRIAVEKERRGLRQWP